MKLATELGVSRRTLSYYLNGPNPAPAETLWKIEGLLALEPGQAFRDGEPELDGPYKAHSFRNLGKLKKIELLTGERLARESAELIGWAEFLPCSLESEDFTNEHHISIFQETYRDEVQHRRIVGMYNAHGSGARKRFDSGRSGRFVHVMFESDLRLISDRECFEYKACSTTSRRNCIERLIELLIQKRVDLRLVEAAGRREKTLRSKSFWKKPPFDSMVVIRMGEEAGEAGPLSFWRERTGSVGYSTNGRVVQEHDRLLREISDAANGPDNALAVVRSIREQLASRRA